MSQPISTVITILLAVKSLLIELTGSEGIKYKQFHNKSQKCENSYLTTQSLINFKLIAQIILAEFARC